MNPARSIYCVFFLLAGLPLNGQNGIDAGRAKVYDNRALTLMLESLNDQLKQVQVVNQSTLATALGMLQGYQNQEVIRAGSFQAAIPFKDPAQAASDTPLPPKIPALAGVPWDMNTKFTDLTPSSENKYGLNAGDLLSDQVNLTYQIFNIRMLLDRSLSDRIHNHDPRLQAVLGFNVTLDPPRDAVDSAAIVEVKIRHKIPNRRVSVVALLPQERTYNSAALNTRSNAFGGSAVAKLMTVGYSERRRGQTYYLFRDNDTISFERMETESKDSESKKHKESGSAPATFGWQFRPVLGRRSVAPGSRQMFAVVALDKRDVPNQKALETLLEVEVITHWRKYHRPTLTTAERGQIPWWNKAGYVLGLGVPFVYPPSGVGRSAYDLPVPTTYSFQKDLSPSVADVAWTWVGKKELLVSVGGSNFFKDTKVVVGGKVLDSPPAMTIKSDQAIDLLVDAANLSDAAILGRYGSATPLRDAGVPWRLKIEDVDVSSSVGGFRWLDVTLAKAVDNLPEASDDLTIGDLPAGGAEARLAALTGKLTAATATTALVPVFSMNGVPIPGPWSLFEINKKPGCPRVLARALVSADTFKEMDGLITVLYPFKGAGLTANYKLNDPLKIIEIQRLHDAAKEAQLLLTAKGGIKFAIGWNAILNDGTKLALKHCSPPAAGQMASTEEFCLLSSTVATLRSGKLMTGEKLILESPPGGPIPVAVYPIAVPKKKEEKTAEKAPPAINQYDSRWVPLDLDEGFKDFETAEIDGRLLEKTKEIIKETKSEKVSKVEVYLNRTLTTKPGMLEITFRDSKGALTNRAKVVVNCVDCQSKETKKP